MLKGDRAVGDCFGTAAGLDEELGQVGAQPDVIGSGFYGTRQGFNQGIGHPASLELGAATGNWRHRAELSVCAVHRITDVCADASVGNLPTLRP